MKKVLSGVPIAILGIVALVLLVFKGNPKHETVRDAYIHGNPLVTMDMTRRQFTNVDVPDAKHAPMGQAQKMRA
jgi:hypothetical protein